MIKAQSVYQTAYQLFWVVSIVSCLSFVCLLAYCLSYSLNVARYAFKNKIVDVLNKQAKSAPTRRPSSGSSP